MKFSRDWLAQYVELPASDDDLAATLTGVGLAVEGREARGGDVLLDLDVTSNRADCMNHLGLAREIAASLEAEVREPEVEPPAAVHSETNGWGSIRIEDTEGCPRYTGVSMHGVRIGPSPDWLVERLEAIGVRPINNVVDVTNFVLWEYGQPLHAFDADRLRDRQVVVRRARDGEVLVTLDGERRELDSDVLVIADGDGAVALAGIMGGAESEVGDSTRNLLIESAHFDPRRVRLGAKKLGLHTDASHRFERGADQALCLEAALRAATLIRDLAGGELEPVAIDVWPLAATPLAGRFSREGLNAFSGAEIPAEFVESRLARLGFELEREDGSSEGWRVVVPSWRRFDFETDPSGEVYPAYFYEEVLRHFGFDRIAATVPASTGPDAGAPRFFALRQRAREYLAAAGLCETVTYSFGSREQAFRFASLAEGRGLEVANALSEQYSVLQRSLLPGLVEGALFNVRRGADSVRLFEMGHVFGAGGEIEMAGLLIGGGADRPWESEGAADFFDLKGLVEGWAEHQAHSVELRPADLDGFLDGTAAEILVGGRRVGHAGRVDEPESPVALFAAEIALDAFRRTEPDQVEAPSKFPGVDVDLTLTHAVEVPWARIAERVEEIRPAELVDFGLKDRYLGEGVPEGAVSTTIAFRYGAPDRSLTQAEVNESHARLSAELTDRFGVAG